MARPIKPNPILRGKSAKEFINRFLANNPISKEKMERNKRDVELYRSVKPKTAIDKSYIDSI